MSLKLIRLYLLNAPTFRHGPTKQLLATICVLGTPCLTQRRVFGKKPLRPRLSRQALDMQEAHTLDSASSASGRTNLRRRKRGRPNGPHPLQIRETAPVEKVQVAEKEAN